MRRFWFRDPPHLELNQNPVNVTTRPVKAILNWEGVLVRIVEGQQDDVQEF
jgi:hypothetical protein